MGFKPPEQRIPIFKWLLLNNLGSKTLGQIQNLVPHRLMCRFKIQDHSRRPKCWSYRNSPLSTIAASRYGRYETALQRRSQVLERSGAIAQATLTKIYLGHSRTDRALEA
jgi:hypothetical protein